MTRKELREHVFRILFTCEFYRPDEDDIREQIDLYFTHEPEEEMDYPPAQVDEEQIPEIKERAADIASRIGELDDRIDEVSAGWKTSRMSRCDLTILRLAAYEMLFDDHVPTGVAISEAVLLAKKFGGDSSSSFVNGILAKLNRSREEAGAGAKAEPADGESMQTADSKAAAEAAVNPAEGRTDG